MCEARQKIKELRSKRTLGKADLIALAEAQSRDYLTHQQEHKTMIARVEKMEQDLSSVKEKMGVMQEDIATIKGQMAVIVKYIESPADAERTKGRLFDYLGTLFKKPVFWVAVIIVALAGEKLATILEHLFPNLF